MDAASQLYSAAQALRTGGPAHVRAALVDSRARTDALIDAWLAHRPSLRVPYRPTLNPPLWEWGHVAWFQEWWIARNAQRSRGVVCDPSHARVPSAMPEAEALYDSSRVAHRTRWELALPDVATTREWLRATLEQTLRQLAELGASPTDDELYFFRLVALHEEMHAEAGAYMAEALGVPVPASVVRTVDPLAGDGAVLRLAGGELLAGWAGSGFAFDNELPAHRVQVAPFEIDAEPVGWARFLAFAEAGGYETRRWWDDAGWAWLQANGRPAHEAHATPGAAATHLSAFEAQAWCRWAGRRLPTEYEWEFAATTCGGFRWGHAWEWTATRFEPYDGFVAHPYRDYSAPWFGSRLVMRGASPATGVHLAHPRYRNFFEPHRADTFAGFRSCA